MTNKKDHVGECRSCGADIVWTVTSTGKKMPCDVQPSPRGDFYLFRREDHIAAVHRMSPDAKTARDRDQRLHACHFVTCPKMPPKEGSNG